MPGRKPAPAPDSTATIPEKVAPAQPPKTDLNQKAGSLTDKLNVNNGVVHPEGNVDPSIHKPGPTTGKMPVIPPPGSPGNSSDDQPQ